MATNPQDSWSEVCLISISQLTATPTDFTFQGLTANVNVELAEKDIESVALVNGGRVVNFKPQEDTTITFEAYPVQAGTASGTVGQGFFDLMNSGAIAGDNSQPLTITNNRTRVKSRVALMWCADASQTQAHAVTNSAYEAMRMVFADGFITSVQPDYSDKHLKFTIKYKVPAFDKLANSNIKFESTDGTTSIAALSAYSTSTKW